MSDSGEAIRVFVLLAWHPALGAPADPVGVLAVAATPGVDEASPSRAAQSPGELAWYVAWIPNTAGRDELWRARLAAAPTWSTLTRWLGEGGAAGLSEIAVPVAVPAQGTSDGPLIDGLLEAAADVLVDLLLAELGPELPA
jgi:hypothetical protein